MLQWRFLPTLLGSWSVRMIVMIDSGALPASYEAESAKAWRAGPQMDETSAIGDVLADIAPSGFSRLVIGITHPQTCLVLRGRLRALRRAGFDVTLVSSPGPLLDALGRLDDIQTVGLPIEREIA